MRNHPSVIYLRDILVASDVSRNLPAERKTVTLAFKVVEDLDGMQHLAAGISVPHSDEIFVTESLETQNGLDSYPVDLEHPKRKYPFVKSEGRNRALARLHTAISKLPAETNFRGEGYVCMSNTNVNLCQGGYYQLMKKFIYVPEGQVIPLLDMAKPVLAHIATDMFSNRESRFEQWMGTNLEKATEGSVIDLATTFRSKEL